MPNARFLRASLKHWRAVHARSQRQLDAAHRRDDSRAIAAWHRRLQAAGVKIRLRQRQLEAKKPLRVRAWQEMQKLIDAGVTEHGGNNLGAAVVKIIREAGGTPGEAWCSDTVMVCYLRAGAKTVQRAWASVSWLNRLLAAVPRKLVRQGHIVTYKFDHTGLFDRWAPEAGPGWFYAGEGNTGDSGAVSDSKTGGDGVKLKLRHINQVAAFRRVTA